MTYSNRKESKDNIAPKFRILIRLFDLKQIELAEALGCSKGSVNSWFKGRAIPSRQNMNKIAVTFGVNIDWFFSYSVNAVTEESWFLKMLCDGGMPEEVERMFSISSLKTFRRQKDMPPSVKVRIVNKLKEIVPHKLISAIDLDQESEVGRHEDLERWPDDPQLESVFKKIEKALSSISADTLKTVVELMIKDLAVMHFEYKRNGRY